MVSRPPGGRCRGRGAGTSVAKKKSANNDMGYIRRREEVPVGGPGKRVDVYLGIILMRRRIAKLLVCSGLAGPQDDNREKRE